MRSLRTGVGGAVEGSGRSISAKLVVEGGGTGSDGPGVSCAGGVLCTAGVSCAGGISCAAGLGGLDRLSGLLALAWLRRLGRMVGRRSVPSVLAQGNSPR